MLISFFFHRRPFESGLDEAMCHQIYVIIIKICIRAKRKLFCHVCNNTSGLKFAKNVIRTIFVFGISGLNRQIFWIMRLLSEGKLLMTNLLRFTTHKAYIQW